LLVYFLSFFKVISGTFINLKIESLLKYFLWVESEETHKIHWVHIH